MNPFNSNKQQQQQLQHHIHHAFTSLQTHCSAFFQSLTQNPSLQDLQHQSLQPLRTLLSSTFSRTPPPFARIPLDNAAATRPQLSSTSMTTEAIEERLAGVPVYALCNSNEEFVLVSGASTKKSLGLFCFKKEDADALLHQMKSMDPAMRKAGSKVVPVALNKVFQLKLDGVAFRLVPESSQVKNALREREKAGFSHDAFPGVPVFQSKSLVLKSQNKSYRPAFFRKEDLEKSLLRASRQQNKLNPVFGQGDIEVAVFEEVLKNMKDTFTSNWDDVVFIPPGFDVSTDPAQQQAAGND